MARAELSADPPRVVVAGLAGDAGKTLVTLGLVKALGNRGFKVAPFKKGPDFIDAAWLGAAAGTAGRNLDSFLMSTEVILASLAQASHGADIAVVEGNRGLYDGFDAAGSHSTAELAKRTATPVILVVDATKSTRTVAALVLGCQKLDPAVPLAGVIVNRVGTERQQKLIREAINDATGLPVFGAIPRLSDQHLPSRHLGLVTAIEHPRTRQVIETVGRRLEQHLDVSAILNVARGASPLTELADYDQKRLAEQSVDSTTDPAVRIGVLRDRAFSFYYPENLAALERAGGKLVFISPLKARELPAIDALYAGGGFPEVHAAKLAANHMFRAALAQRINEGLPVWAECGGLAYLAQAIVNASGTHPMVGVLPVVIQQQQRPQGHGYVCAQVDEDNPFLKVGTEFRGHEFHYTQLRDEDSSVPTVVALSRGVGVGAGRDGITVKNVVATYTHVHALGTEQWAPSMVAAARTFRPTADELLAAEPVDLSAAPPVDVAVPAAAHDARQYSRNRAKALGADGPQRRVSRPRFRGNKQRHGSLRRNLREAVAQGRIEGIERLVASDPRVVRHLLALTYQPDPQIRQLAARGLALAGSYHPRTVQTMIRRLVWAMKEDSGTNAVTVPEVVRAVAEHQPELLLPVVPELIGFTKDESLREGIAEALRLVVKSCPGKVGAGLLATINQCPMPSPKQGGAHGAKPST